MSVAAKSALNLGTILAIKAREILSGYGQIYFSTKWYVGLFFMAATFVVPYHGLSGLGTLVLSNLFARILGLNDDHIKEGFFAFNGLLIGLALGLTYKPNLAFFIVLVLAAFAGVIISATLRALFERYLYVPVLSLSFVFASWLVIAAGKKFHGLEYALKPFQVTLLSNTFPDSVNYFLCSLGAAFFQLSIPSGLLIALGLFIASRQSFLLAILGLISGTVVFKLLGGEMVGLMGFNFILTAIAVGGMWFVPGIDSYILATLAAALAAVVATASRYVLTILGLPILAFPFVLTVVLIVYAMKHRIKLKPLKTIAVPAESPEGNLKRERNRRARFVTGEIPYFHLPVNGLWTISQGFNSEPTHKSLWSHAWDFEIFDDSGKPYKDRGMRPDDFHAYGLPVLAPADGKLVTVVGHIEDNRIGQTNPENNWGNTVVLWHYGSVYTALSHLKKGSITVQEGEFVRKGQVIAKVGNSGRSPVPHLHMQVQTSPEIGAPTILSELMHYVSSEEGRLVYHTHGCPEENDKVKSLDISSTLFDMLSFSLGGKWRFKVEDKERNKTYEEDWETDIDFLGNRYLVCREMGARIRYFVNKNVLLLLDYQGPAHRGLHWFFMGVSRVPMTQSQVIWEDELPGDSLLSKPAAFFYDLAEPFYPPARLLSATQFTANSNQGITLSTTLTSKGVLAPRKNITIYASFMRYEGLVELSVELEGEVLMHLKQIKVPDNEE